MLAFDRLFKDDNQQNDKCVLDAVLEEARSLRGRISCTDRIKLDEYLNSVAKSNSESSGPVKSINCKVVPDTLQAEHSPTRRRRTSRHRRTHAADVRYPRACIPN